ncbi:hypothetical protein [Bacillus sp. AFS055030]|uniref:hypothetical protein n=1 Tax=Bacillus sp. AFS055030 TaxID=2033507 RepID=UPI000BFDBFC3|nr:hypothetical protein [Bacillus sp. AFS055030]PGL66779.1 hypothetical protein CN925_20930 [Bacillus sp. AFS055030]
MKKIIILFTILVLTACSHGNGAVESLKKEYPKTIRQVVNQLPKDVQEELVVPKKIPFIAKDVSMDVQKNENGAINATLFKYSNEEREVILFVITYHNKKPLFPNEQQQLKTTKLKDGTKVFIVADDDNTKTIRWKKDGLYHSISILFSEETGKQYTIRDLVRSADSMSK